MDLKWKLEVHRNFKTALESLKQKVMIARKNSIRIVVQSSETPFIMYLTLSGDGVLVASCIN